jgi:hypothetical protein
MHVARKTRHGAYDVVLKPGKKYDVLAYRSAHNTIVRARGKAREHQCGRCAWPAVHWAYDHTDPAPVVDDRGRIYSLDPNRYVALCVACHGRFDAEAAQRFGGSSVRPRARNDIRHVEIDDDIWLAVKAYAKASLLLVPEVVDAALRDYMKER